MKFRAAPIVYRAVCEGLVQGMQHSKAAGDGTTGEQVIEITAASVMAKLNEVLIFDQEEENLNNLQRIAEEIAGKSTTTT
jgi:3-hydroxyacyl-CoA dehydrogenase